MNFIQDLLKWTDEIPAWQSDALRRLFICHTLNAQDKDELFALMKVSHGLKTDLNPPSPIRLTKAEIPLIPGNTEKIVLISMYGLKGINAISSQEKLQFEPKGITAIYGKNGVGKSGYAKTLKKACRSRDTKEKVLPNAFIDDPYKNKQEVTFDFRVDDKELSEKWLLDSSPLEKLSSVAVFDSRCERVYINEKNNHTYVPYGLGSIEKLARLCDEFRLKVQNEIKGISIDAFEFKDLESDTPVGNLIRSLTPKTSVEEIEKLANLTEDEIRRIDEIKKNLSSSDPKARIQQLSKWKLRLNSTISKVEEAEKYFLVEIVNRFVQVLEEYEVAEQALTLASQALHNDEQLPGVGSGPWKLLFDAAKKYSEEIAYPEFKFPNVSESARCVLCFQPLRQIETKRFVEWSRFIQEDAQKKRDEALKSFEKGVIYFKSKDILSLKPDEASQTELNEIKSELANKIIKHLEAIDEVRKKYSAVMSTGQVKELGSFPTSLASEMKSFLSELDRKIEDVQSAMTKDGRDKIEKELDQLDKRRLLALMKDRVALRIQKLQVIEKLKKCETSLSTASISRKSTSLIEKVVADDLKQKLIQELNNLKVGKINIELVGGTERGSPYFKVDFKGISLKDIGIADVLSQGEQRAVALASFITEVESLPSINTLVFDDPMSSLDHERREKVAERLATIALEKQVVVFTHDLTFLHSLNSYAAQCGSLIKIRNIDKYSSVVGVCEDKLPWEAKFVKERIKWLKEDKLSLLKKLLPLTAETKEEYQLNASDFYEKLRRTWERAVEEILLNEVVLRFGAGVSTQRLNGVDVRDEDYKEVYFGMGRCSKFVHDRSLEAGPPEIPTLEDLEKDIADFEQFISKVRAQSANASSNRNKLVNAK